MRKMFLVAAKLLGLMQLYSMLMSSLPFLAVSMNYAETYHPSPIQVLLGGASALVWTIFYGWFAWLLLFRTDWLADRLKIRDEPGDDRAFDRQAVLPLGVTLIGLYVVIHALPSLITAIMRIQSEWIDRFPEKQRGQLVSVIIQLLLGVWFTFGANQVVSIITRRERPALNPKP